MALLVPAGAGWLGSFSSLQALVQLWAPERLRARVVALYQMAHLGTWAVASALGGSFADRLGIRAAMTGASVVCAGRCSHHLACPGFAVCPSRAPTSAAG